MAVVRSFKAYRPQKDLVDKVAALPYDVMNSEEAREMVKGNPYSFLHVDKPEVDLEPGIDIHSTPVYEKAKENLWKMVEEKTYLQDEKPCMYIYRQIMNGRPQTGIVACASIDDYINDVIKKHELTRAEKEQDRINHVDYTNANTGPIFLTYRHKDDVKYYDNGISIGKKIHIADVNPWKLDKNKSIGDLTVIQRDYSKSYELYPLVSTEDIIRNNLCVYIFTGIKFISLISSNV